MPAPAGSAFHRLARTPLHRWWRPLAGTLFAVVVGLTAILSMFLGAMVLAAVTGRDALEKAVQEETFGGSTAGLALELLTLAVLTPVVLLAAWTVQRRPVGSLSSVLGRLRARWLLVCAGLAVLACLASYLAGWVAFAATGAAADTGSDAGAWVGWSAFLPPALVVVLLVPFQAAAEEYVFRGWLLQAIASCTLETRTGRIARTASVVLRTPWPAIVISAAVFTSGHAYRGWALLDVFLFGIVAGWLAVRTGGLEASISLHTLNNLVAFLLPVAMGRLSDALRATDTPWQGIVGTAAQLAVFAALVLVSVRRRGIATVTPGGPPGGPVPADGVGARV